MGNYTIQLQNIGLYNKCRIISVVRISNTQNEMWNGCYGNQGDIIIMILC